MQETLSFVVAALALTGSPGPATLGLAAAGAAFGLRRSRWLIAGIVAGVLAVLLLTVSGLFALILAQPGLALAVTIAAALYMLYLAFRIATAPLITEQVPGAAAPGFGQGLFLGLGNPKAYAAMAALCSGFTLLPGQPFPDALAKLALVAATIIPVNIAWSLLGVTLTRWLRDPRLGRAINVLFALLLMASVALTFLV
ncbi:LysE family translocator [Dongia sp.]|uniref:LysE family translocator n=1 Tax=Dongia sp. TaxID=1977262 RepID=UPI0035ADB0C1